MVTILRLQYDINLKKTNAIHYNMVIELPTLLKPGLITKITDEKQKCRRYKEENGSND